MPAPAKLPDGYYVIRDEDDMHRVYRREGDSWVPVPGIRPYKRRVQAVAAAWKHAGYALPWQRVGEESTDI